MRRENVMRERWLRLALPATLAALPAVVGIQVTAGAVGATLVTTCGYVISTPGNYELANDLLSCPGDGVDVLADGVVLDLLGHTIQGQGGSLQVGVEVRGAADTITTSTGSGRISQFGTGVAADGAVDTLVTDVNAGSGNGFGGNVTGFRIEETIGLTCSFCQANGNSTGFYLINADATILDSVTANGGSLGIQVDQSIVTAILSSSAEQNATATGDGRGIDIQASAATQLTDNHVDGNDIGILNRSQTIGTSAEDNLVTSNRVWDIEEGVPACGEDVWLANSFTNANQSCVH